MRSLVLFMVAVVLCATLETGLCVSGQHQALLQIRIGEKWGYINEEGATAIEARYDWTGPFSEGLAAVQVHGKWGYIDQVGEMVIKPQFNYAFPFAEGLAAVEIGKETNEVGKGALWGYINTAGEYVIKPKFWDANSFSEGLAAVMMPGTGSYIFVSRDGEPQIRDGYTWLRRFSGGLAVCYPQHSRLPGCIDKNGELLIKPNQFLVGEFSQGLAPIGITNCYGFVDTTGALAIPRHFGMVRPFSEGLAMVALGDGPRSLTCGFIDTNGTVVIQPQYPHVGMFSEGLAPVKVAGKWKWGFIDRNGSLTIEPEYAWAETFEHGLARVWFDAYPDPPRLYHSTIDWFYPNIPGRPRYDYGYLSKSGRFGYIDKTGNYIWKSSD